MKKNTFIEGAWIATVAIVIVKIIGLLYVIPFNAIIGEQGGALYGYGYRKIRAVVVYPSIQDRAVVC